MNDAAVKKTRKPSANVELEMPLSATVKKVSETLELPQSVVRQALIAWAWDVVEDALQTSSSSLPRSYEQAMKDITLEHLTAKAQKGQAQL